MRRPAATAALIALALLLAACAPRTPPLPERPPDLLLIEAGGLHLPGESTGVCWPDGATEHCIPAPSPNFPAYHRLPEGSQIEVLVEGEGAPDVLKLVLYDDYYFVSSVASTQFDAPGADEPVIWVPDVPPGPYVLSVSAEWRSGAQVGRVYAVRITAAP